MMPHSIGIINVWIISLSVGQDIEHRDDLGNTALVTAARVTTDHVKYLRYIKNEYWFRW